MDLYRNPLAAPADLDGFVLEGDGALTFPQGRLRLESRRDPGEGQAANLVLWCPEPFPDGVEISWDFWPVREPGPGHRRSSVPGGAAARASSRRRSPRRTGPYEQYHSGATSTPITSPTSGGCGLVSARCTPATCASPTASIWWREVRTRCRRSWTPTGPTACPGRSTGAGSSSRAQWFRRLDCWTTGSGGPRSAPDISVFRQMAPLIGEYADLRVRNPAAALDI